LSKYLVLYLSSASAGQQMATATPEQGQAAMNAWYAWQKAAGDAVVDMGSPLAHVATVPSGGDQRGGLYVGGYAIMQADSPDAIRRALEGHPHFAAPDAAIEVHEMLAMPGM
jgi:hypothetical protein